MTMIAMHVNADTASTSQRYLNLRVTTWPRNRGWRAPSPAPDALSDVSPPAESFCSVDERRTFLPDPVRNNLQRLTYYMGGVYQRLWAANHLPYEPTVLHLIKVSTVIIDKDFNYTAGLITDRVWYSVSTQSQQRTVYVRWLIVDNISLLSHMISSCGLRHTE